MAALPRIKALPAAVANQIAAGEVIERPASVIKELIENSIDAAATRINIDLEQAGLSLIRVSDNGQGIHRDDLALALKAHATSKLRAFADLAHIASLGFRGEALPSIASVSRFVLIARPAGAEQAWAIDNTLAIRPAAHLPGATVEARDLFYATPARRRFLKSEKTEYLHIKAMIRAIALSHCQVNFTVRHNDQLLFRLPAFPDLPEKRILGVCGKPFVDQAIRVDIKKHDLRLWGWLGHGEAARSQSDRQYFYVNGRPVRDRHINHAIRLAYGGRIAAARFPAYVLQLELAPARVDVNVHPAKAEVRFAETRQVHDFIYTELMRHLNAPLVAAPAGPGPETKTGRPPAAKSVRDSAAPYAGALFRAGGGPSIAPGKDCLSLLDGRFLVATIGQAPYLIEVAPARRLLTQDYLARHYARAAIIQRPILVPVSVELDAGQLACALAHTDVIKKWGFELEQIAPARIMIRAIPARLAEADTIALVKSLLRALRQGQGESAIARALAAHSNDAGYQPGGPAERQLLREIDACDAGRGATGLPWRKLDAAALGALIRR